CGPAQFSGGYVGGNVGGIAYTGSRQDQDQFLIDNTDNTHTKLGVTAGVQAGYDWQFCNKVVGIVADWNWADTKATLRQDPNTPIFDLTTSGKIKWFSTIRGRAGLAVNDALLYATGGLAIADINFSVNQNFGGGTVNRSFDHTRLG